MPWCWENACEKNHKYPLLALRRVRRRFAATGCATVLKARKRRATSPTGKTWYALTQARYQELKEETGERIINGLARDHSGRPVRLNAKRTTMKRTDSTAHCTFGPSGLAAPREMLASVARACDVVAFG